MSTKWEEAYVYALQSTCDKRQSFYQQLPTALTISNLDFMRPIKINCDEILFIRYCQLFFERK